MMAVASKYFKPEKTGRKSTRVSKGDTFNYRGNIYFIISEPKEYIDSDGYLVVYCRWKLKPEKHSMCYINILNIVNNILKISSHFFEIPLQCVFR